MFLRLRPSMPQPHSYPAFFGKAVKRNVKIGHSALIPSFCEKNRVRVIRSIDKGQINILFKVSEFFAKQIKTADKFRVGFISNAERDIRVSVKL